MSFTFWVPAPPESKEIPGGYVPLDSLPADKRNKIIEEINKKGLVSLGYERIEQKG